jgi:Lrp/AsnC family leucine-responsive transcriptional regulator
MRWRSCVSSLSEGRNGPSAGRIRFTDPGRATGLSVSAVHQRVRRLEERGIIKSSAACVAAEEIGLPLTAFVSLKTIDPAASNDAPQRLAHLEAIEASHSVAGMRITSSKSGYRDREH